MADVVSNTRGGHNFYNRHYWKSFKIFEWGTLFTNRCERLKSRPTSLCWWTSQKGSKILGARKSWMHCPFREMCKRTLVPMTPTNQQREGLIQTDLPFLRKKAPRDWAKNQKSQERELRAFRVRLNTSEISFYWNQYVFGSILPYTDISCNGHVQDALKVQLCECSAAWKWDSTSCSYMKLEEKATQVGGPLIIRNDTSHGYERGPLNKVC